MVNQLIFQPPPVALMPICSDPALRFTVCETVVQLCQPSVDGMTNVSYTCVPPALSSCKPQPQPATRYDTVYVPVVGIVTARWDIQSPVLMLPTFCPPPTLLVFSGTKPKLLDSSQLEQ